MSNELSLKALLFDVDGSIMPQGGKMDEPVSQLFRLLEAEKFPMGRPQERMLITREAWQAA